MCSTTRPSITATDPATVYPILRVDAASSEGLEPLGTKRKFWFTGADGRRMLFKAEERGTGEDWAEKLACELAALLGLPHVHYELAMLLRPPHELAQDSTGVPGVVCASCAPPPSALVLGNQLMLDVDPAYPGQEKYKVPQHTLDKVVLVLERLQIPPPPWSAGLPADMVSALDVYAGYLMLDAWIANQDRHHENWGALRVNGTLHLAPSFDHGASLARNLSDEERKKRLESRDHGFRVEAFATRARSALYADETQRRPMGTLAAFRAWSARAPGAAEHWIRRLEAIDEAQVEAMLRRIPPHRISAIGRDFTHRLLSVNRSRILSGVLQ